jgi:hypothetical protein
MQSKKLHLFEILVQVPINMIIIYIRQIGKQGFAFHLPFIITF